MGQPENGCGAIGWMLLLLCGLRMVLPYFDAC